MFGKKLLSRDIDGNVTWDDARRRYVAPDGYRVACGHGITDGSASVWWLVCERCGAAVFGLSGGTTHTAGTDFEAILSSVPLHDDWHR